MNLMKNKKHYIRFDNDYTSLKKQKISNISLLKRKNYFNTDINKTICLTKKININYYCTIHKKKDICIIYGCNGINNYQQNIFMPYIL